MRGYLYNKGERQVLDMRFIFKMVILPFSLLTAFLALMLKLTLNLSAFVLALPMDEMEEQVRAATMRYHELGDSIKAAEARMAEIAVMKTHIINYAKTRSIYEAYRKAGYSKRFLEANRESIALHKAAKAAFDEAGLKKLPKVKELSIEYVELLKKKKAEYPSYRKARERMQELMKAQKNVEMFFADNRSEQEQQQTR